MAAAAFPRAPSGIRQVMAASQRAVSPDEGDYARKHPQRMGLQQLSSDQGRRAVGWCGLGGARRAC